MKRVEMPYSLFINSKGLQQINIAVAVFTTSYARLKLLGMMEKRENRLTLT